MNDCIFCRIVKGEIPSEIVYRDDSVVAFKDLNPQAPVHVLVVPIKHVPSLLDQGAIASETLVPVYKAIQTLVPKLSLDKGFRVVTNHGDDGGQTVHHIHFHVLGRRRMSWPPG